MVGDTQLEPITSETILILAGSFLCVFISLVTLGGSFLYWRTRQLNNSSLPAPTPPAVTRDVHAKPLGETPTRDESVDSLPPSPPPIPAHAHRASPESHSTGRMEPEAPTIQDTLAMPPVHQTPLGAEPLPFEKTDALTMADTPPLGMDFDTIAEGSDGSETVTRELRRPPVQHINLPNQNQSDNTPTVIINRNQPRLDDENDEEVP